MSDDIKQILYGKTGKVRLADGNEYTLREPCIDALESLNVDLANLNDLGNIKKIAWILLKDDNTALSEKSFGRLITFSMMIEGSDFMNAFRHVLGIKENPSKNA